MSDAQWCDRCMIGEVVDLDDGNRRCTRCGHETGPTADAREEAGRNEIELVGGPKHGRIMPRPKGDAVIWQHEEPQQGEESYKSVGRNSGTGRRVFAHSSLWPIIDRCKEVLKDAADSGEEGGTPEGMWVDGQAELARQILNLIAIPRQP